MRLSCAPAAGAGQSPGSRMHPRFGTDWRRRHPHHAASHAQHPGCCIPHEDAHKDPSLSDPMEIRLLLAGLLTDKIKCLAKMAADALAQQHLRWHGDGIETANQRWLGKAGSIPKDAATPGNTNILSRIITQARISPRSSKCCCCQTAAAQIQASFLL